MNVLYDPDVQFAVETAKQAGEILLKYFGTKLTRTIKSGPKDFATEADQAAEDLILMRIRERYPDDSIISEESGTFEKENAEYTWIVDPLDGTYNFAHGKGEFGTMISRSRQGAVVLAVVYSPLANILVVGKQNEGVLLNGERVELPASVSEQARLSISPALTGTFDFWGKEAGGVSACGDLILGLQGKLDALVWHNGYVWDHSPAALFYREAGWKVTDIKGNDFRTDGPLESGFPGLIAAPEGFHGKLLETLKE